MAFTSASMKAVGDYLKNHARGLGAFEVIGLEYDPGLSFGRQSREVVAARAGDFAKKHKNKKWLSIIYGRKPLSFNLKRHMLVRPPIPDMPGGDWQRREVHCNFGYTFFSPSPELLEELEEKFVVMDLGHTINAEVMVGIRGLGSKTPEKFYPFSFIVNLEQFAVENFEHFADPTEGVFSIFSTNAIVNFPVIVPEFFAEDSIEYADKIVVSFKCGGENSEIEQFEIP